MSRFSLRLPDAVHSDAQAWAERDGLSLNDWLVAAIDREAVRRRLSAHNTWVRDNPIYSEDRYLAEQQDIVDARQAAAHRDVA